jgi:MATE family multidrug resistance protein
MSIAFRVSRADVAALFSLAVPIVVVQVGLMFMGVVDTVVVGHVSSIELAAAALGNLYFFALCVFGMGTLMAIDPLVSQAVGAGDQAAVTRGLQRGIVIASILCVPATLLCLPAEPVLRLLRQPQDVVPRAAAFVLVSAPGAGAFLLFVVLRQSLQAMNRTRPIVITILAGNVINAALNWVFVFGHLGAPAMGATGSALSSTIGRWCMTALLLWLSWPQLRAHLAPWRRDSLHRGPLARTLALGLPIGTQYMLEFGAFAVIALLAGWFGPDAMGGHQIAINLASLTFMVPLGVSSAAAVLVGHAIGEGDGGRAQRVAGAALLCGAAFMALTALLLLGSPGLLARTYTSVPGVLAVAAALIPIAGVFQVFDGLQVVSSGILRGAGDTRAPMIINVLAFWLVGMPVSLWLGFSAGGGVVGLWWGFVAGLAAVASLLVARVWVRLGRPLERVRIDAATP